MKNHSKTDFTQSIPKKNPKKLGSIMLLPSVFFPSNRKYQDMLSSETTV